MTKKTRDDFSQSVKDKLAKLAGYLCSDPSCRRHTVGSNSDGDTVINLGTAAHICAAAPGGPRYDANMTPQERSSVANGIWLCSSHGRAVDVKDSKFTIQLLHEWKDKAQQDSLRRVLYGESPIATTIGDEADAELTGVLHLAATEDLEVFRRSEKWPFNAIDLTLEIEGISEHATPAAIAKALVTFDDLILIAPPGMGKTTTLFQIAESVLNAGTVVPIVIPLGDWSADTISLLESVLKRQAFREISEHNLRAVASKSGLALLLDGWNELDNDARRRAAAQIRRLKLELPELHILLSTRKQALDVPIEGARINLLPLSEDQQLEIARNRRGDVGEGIVDQAWRTKGVRELVTIPLYLTAILTLQEGSPFPTTKEEILRKFVAAHEDDNQRVEALMPITQGLQQRFLDDLAVTATRADNTTINDADARKSISESVNTLVTEGQITEKLQPGTVLEALVSHHVIMRAGDPVGYSFQHQQFQEWYASHYVERVMLLSVNDEIMRKSLKEEILNQPTWEESILFACERLDRGSFAQRKACGVAILAAFEVDPILAAEMIYRSTDSAWLQVESTIKKAVNSWHMPGTVDRALRFMISSGRNEFFDQVWPLITHENEQIHLGALRSGTKFRTSILGLDASKRLAALPLHIRKNVLSEIASYSGMDGIELVSAVAKNDPELLVKASVVEALAFRRADRHVIDVLQDADDKTFDMVLRTNLLEGITNERVQIGLAAASERRLKNGSGAYDQMQSIIVHDPKDGDRSAELVSIITDLEIDSKRDGAVTLIFEAEKIYPKAVAEGILGRVRNGSALPYEAVRLMESQNFSFEDASLLAVSLEETRLDERACAAASVLGPSSVGKLIDKMFDVELSLRDSNGNLDKDISDYYHSLLRRIASTRISNLLAAVKARSAQASNFEIVEIAHLISNHLRREDFNGRENGDVVSSVSDLVTDWSNRLLMSSEVKRSQLASIASLAGAASTTAMLPIIRRLLDEDLRMWRVFKNEAIANQFRVSTATNEARSSWTQHYQSAFESIDSPETFELMRSYLSDIDFGVHAANVLVRQWRTKNEAASTSRFKSRPDFSRVHEKRVVRASDPNASSMEADVIFEVVDKLITADAENEMKKLAVDVGSVATTIPHGQRQDTIQILLKLADRTPRVRLLTNLVLSGEIIDVEIVRQGIAEVLEMAQKQTWLLTDQYELRDWLRLLPFTNRPEDTLDIFKQIYSKYPNRDTLEEFLNALVSAPGDESENVLFKLAEDYPFLYENREWSDAVFRRGTYSSARRIFDLVVSGIFNGKEGAGNYYLSTSLANSLATHPALREYVYEFFNKIPTVAGIKLLIGAISETSDTQGLLLLIKAEEIHKQPFTSWRMIQNVVTAKVPIDNFSNVYNVIAVPAIELRKSLLALTTDGGVKDVAARCLNFIDKIRDDMGGPTSEPRHPDLASGKSWPIMVPDPDAE